MLVKRQGRSMNYISKSLPLTFPFVIWPSPHHTFKNKTRRKHRDNQTMTHKSIQLCRGQFKINSFKTLSWLKTSSSNSNVSTAPSCVCGYLLQHTLGNLHMLHGDELAELLQSVNIANLIHELNTAEDIKSMPIRRNDNVSLPPYLHQLSCDR